MNYWPRWIGSIQKKTSHLSLAEMGAYDRLLDHYYANEAPLPADVDRCCRICGATAKGEREAVARVLAEFFTLTDGGYTNERATHEIAYAKPKTDAARANGLKGGRPPKSQQEPKEKPSGFPAGTQVESSSTSYSTLVPKEPSRGRGSRLPADWQPGHEGIAFAESCGLRNGRANAEVERFRDYWSAQPGQKGVKTDWPATWRNWARRAGESAPRASATPASDPFAGAL